jgi:transcriptional/translational regulatory protein YebC/TACO1
LTWEDFKGKPNKSSRYQANANSGFSYSWGFGIKDGEPDFNYEVKSWFYPKDSWVKVNSKSESLLAHEQLHFDISELYARKMREFLAGFHPQSIQEAKTELKKAHTKIERERIKLQNLYDIETKHGNLNSQQLKWQKRIAEELSKLEEYSF